MLASPTQGITIALRALYGQVISIRAFDQSNMPHLTRMVDQADYFLQLWPEECWPSVSRLGAEIPSQAQLTADLHQLQHLCIPAFITSPHEATIQKNIHTQLQQILLYFL